MPLKRSACPTGLLAVAFTMLVGGCGGSDSGSSLSPPANTSDSIRVSQASPYASDCGGGMAGSVSYENAEVEPYVAVNPVNPSNLIGVWQQDRWSDGGAHGLVAGYSNDGGNSWKEVELLFSRCAGGDSTNGADYARASDPWVSIAPDGTAYATSISFSGNVLQTGSKGSVLVVRSQDGGATWSAPVALIVDGANAFNDKETLTADPNDAHFVYEVWDRLTLDNHGAAYFARTTDGGNTWAPARAIFDPGVDNQTLGNVIVGLPDGTIADIFDEIDGTSSNAATSRIRLVTSSDHGASWSKPVTVAQNMAIGTRDPDTQTLVRDGAGLPQPAVGPDGALYVVWQDARFSNGQRDGILLSHSSDDGLTWSTPVQINSVASAPAFTPSLAVRGDGTLGVTYFDFRNNTSDKSTLPTDYWFITSDDGSHWSEQHVDGSFDLDTAPYAEGLFLGDYQALGVMGQSFVPFYVRSNPSADNPTDAYVWPPKATKLTVQKRAVYTASLAAAVTPGPAFRRDMHENIMQLLRAENPQWDTLRAERQKTATPPQ